MTLDTQDIDLRLVQGADTKTDDKNVLQGSMQSLVNLRQTKIGEFIPRDGLTRHVALGTAATGFELLGDNGSVVAGKGTHLFTVSEGVARPSGTHLPGTLSRDYLGPIDFNTCSVAASDTHVVVAWRNNGLKLAIIDIATKAIMTLGDLTGLSGGYVGGQIQVVYLNGQFVLFCADVFYDLKAYRIDFLNNPTGSLFSVLTWSATPTGTTRIRFAACSNGSVCFVGYSIDDSSTVSYQTLTLSGSTLTSTSSATAFTVTGVAQCVSVTRVSSGTAAFGICAVAEGTHYKAAVYTTAGVLVGSVQTQTVGANFDAGIIRLSQDAGTGAMIGQVWGPDTTDNDPDVYTFSLSNTTFSPSGPFSAGLRPWTGSAVVQDLNVGINDHFSSATYGSQPLSLVSAAGYSTTPVAYLGVGANCGRYLQGELEQAPNPAVSGSKIFFVCPVINGISDISSLSPSLNSVVETAPVVPTVYVSLITLDTAQRGTAIIEGSNNQSLYLGTGPHSLGTAAYAGAWPEPYQHLGDLSVVTSGAEVAGIVSYVFAVKYTSPEGAIYRSWGETFTANLAASKQLQVQFKNSYNANNIEIYRTERNGTVFYKTYSAVSVGGTIIDTTTESQLVQNELAEINGAELPSTLWPAARLVGRYRGRIVLNPADNPYKLLFDKPTQAPNGTVFAAGLEIDLPEQDGPPTGLQQMDGTLYIAKRNQILTLSGDPPGPTGEGGTLNIPQVIVNGVGCVDPRSMILTPKGILFKSEKGFYLLMRNQELTFAGYGPFDDRASKVVGSGISNDKAEVYFALQNGSVWVLNLDIMGWYEWTIGTTPSGLTVVDDDILIGTDSEVLNYKTGTLTDTIGGVTSNIATDMQTGWFRLNGIRGYQRCRRLYLLGEKLGPCILTIDVLVDYESTPAQTITLDLTGSSVDANPLQIDLHLARQKCEAMSFRIRSDRPGLALSGATIEIGVKKGPDKSASSSVNAKG